MLSASSMLSADETWQLRATKDKLMRRKFNEKQVKKLTRGKG